ncbi:MAG: hypothetical protein COA81_10460 [Alphaproteobacteria bacterium]|nr:MAG: hypothetical protein COA81_10460 [Alphaproteobacteria bacterium]
MIRAHVLSAADRLHLECCVCRQREDHGIARRANAILLLDDGESCRQIAKFLYLDDETVYFADAVHPEHQTKPVFGWVRKGSNPAVKTTTGRGRVNIHGAVMHAHVTHNHFYATQKQFAEAIRHFLRETTPKEWRKFRDQVTDNFRIISHQNFGVLQ